MHTTTELSLAVEGMTCASCVNRVERFLRKTDGVVEANVNLATEQATIRFDPTLVGLAELEKAVEDAGYEVRPDSDAGSAHATAQALALADAVSPECGVCLDTFHLNIEEEDMYEAIRLAGKRLFDFHVADNNRFAAGLGHLDWTKIIGTLKEIGYDGAVTNEFVAPVDRTPANKYPTMVERNPVDIPPEQLKFIQDHGSSLLTEDFYADQMRITAETILPLIK
jgi:sugar phosphate isomerase/epimerase